MIIFHLNLCEFAWTWYTRNLFLLIYTTPGLEDEGTRAFKTLNYDMPFFTQLFTTAVKFITISWQLLDTSGQIIPHLLSTRVGWNCIHHYLKLILYGKKCHVHQNCHYIALHRFWNKSTCFHHLYIWSKIMLKVYQTKLASDIWAKSSYREVQNCTLDSILPKSTCTEQQQID